jgi:dTDP-4-dehydrorhamnose reductase
MSKKKNILVVGANGLLGTAFRTEMQGCDNYYFGVRKYTDIKGLDVVLGNLKQNVLFVR